MIYDDELETDGMEKWDRDDEARHIIIELSGIHMYCTLPVWDIA